MAATPYMSLTLPIPTVTLGPAWAIELNAALELIDSHDHTPGKGRLITSAALNINADLDINQQDLRNARSLTLAEQLTPLAGPTDIRSIFAVGDDLFYRDGLGNTIQITAAGALNAGTVGGIGGDYITSSALVSYNSLSQTFYFHQATSPDFISAKIDSGDITLREAIANAEGVTLKSPSGLALSYDITMPTGTPGSTLPLLMASNGDLSTGQLGSTQIAANAITTTQLADDAVTAAKIAPNQVVSTWFREEFVAGGTWTRPTGVDNITVRVVAGGGGGGGGGGFPASGGDSGGAGGSGGAAGQVIMMPVKVTAASYTITVGAAGTGGAAGPQLVNGSPGTAGGNSSFVGSDASITALGGAAGLGGECGQVGVSSTGGASVGAFSSLTTATYRSGSGGSGRVSFNAGDAGSAGESSPFGTGGTAGLGTPSDAVGSGGGGGGGAAALGAGGTGANARQGGGLTPAASPGGVGAGYGSGGGGGAGCPANAVAINNPSAGGAGAPGIVEIFYAKLNA